jgi:hypothetical protein
MAHVYSNAQNIDWVDELDLKIGDEVIEKETDEKWKEFENGTPSIDKGQQLIKKARELFNNLPYETDELLYGSIWN